MLRKRDLENQEACWGAHFAFPHQHLFYSQSTLDINTITVRIAALNNIHSYPLKTLQLWAYKNNSNIYTTLVILFKLKKKNVIASKIIYLFLIFFFFFFLSIENKLKISVWISLESKRNNANFLWKSPSDCRKSTPSEVWAEVKRSCTDTCFLLGVAVLQLGFIVNVARHSECSSKTTKLVEINPQYPGYFVVCVWDGNVIKEINKRRTPPNGQGRNCTCNSR